MKTKQTTPNAVTARSDICPSDVLVPEEVVNQRDFDGTGSCKPIIESDINLEHEERKELNSEPEETYKIEDSPSSPLRSICFHLSLSASKRTRPCLIAENRAIPVMPIAPITPPKSRRLSGNPNG